MATLAAPGSGGAPAAGATCLAVGALAVLAGHTWGLLVVATAHVALVGRLWPTIALSGSGAIGTGEAVAIAIVLATLLPTLAFSALLLPSIVEHLLPESSRRARSLVVAGGALLLAASLVLPAVATHSSSRAAATAPPPASADGHAIAVGRTP